ncbi:MAG: sulfatase [Zavarzinella sp.]
MRTFSLVLFFSLALIAEAKQPNVVLIFADDLGYGDLGCYGNSKIRTPNIDQLAKDGSTFRHFYVAQPVCTASRAALMTGCYANRVGLAGALNHTSLVGINPTELTMGELFKANGYATGIYGKWHLGLQEQFHPAANGFDDYLGIPYSNDNGPLHPTVPGMPALPLFDGKKIVEKDPDQALFTRRLTERAVNFIKTNREKPFFLYMPHIMPHVPIFASDRFRGKSQFGLYGDVIEELDWSVGEICKSLKEMNLERDTLVIFTSDNGPFLSYGEHAGSSGALREGKLTTFEGGVRTPCIMRWPGTIPPGATTDELLTSFDLLPTFAAMLNAKLADSKIDGVNQLEFLKNAGKGKSSRTEFWYYAGEELHAVRSGPWKLHLPHEYLTVAAAPGKGGKPSNFENMKPLTIKESGLRGIASRHGYAVRQQPFALYHLLDDPGETKNQFKNRPEVVDELMKIVENARTDLGDRLTKRTGKNVRTVGKVPEP